MTLKKVLDKHFNKLDESELDSDHILNSAERKEYYESIIMFAYRKLSSLSYHIFNVNNLIEQEYDTLNAKSLELEGEIIDTNNLSGMTMKMKKDAFEYINELSAFLSAIKSCLDLLSEVFSFYLKGVDVNYSISPLLKLSKKKDSKILTFVRKNEDWIKLVIEYRHPLLHRLVLRSDSGFEIHSFGKKTTKTLYPVLVPSSTPKFVSDTRKQRMLDDMEDDFANTNRFEKKATITTDGAEKIIEHEITYEASTGYAKIEDFMNSHRDNCEKYLLKSIKLLDDLKFKYDVCT